MVDPKKEYEILMRYLQGGALQRQPAEASEPAFQDTRPEVPPQAPVARAVVTEKKRTSTLPRLRNLPRLSLPQLPSLSAVRPFRLATAVLAVVVLLFLLQKGYHLYQLSADKLFNQLYVPIGLGATPPESNSIEYYYKTGNFVAVTLKSNRQPQFSHREQLLAGLAYLHRGDYLKAIKWLEPAANNFKSPYRRYAEFYLALTYLKNEDYDNSITWLERIEHTPGHPFANRISARTVRDIKMLKWK
jgi:tetratricopeptide (TPR) repeat protein